MATKRDDAVTLVSSDYSDEESTSTSTHNTNPGRSWNRYAAEGYQIVHNNNEPKTLDLGDDGSPRKTRHVERQLSVLLVLSLLVVVGLIVALIVVSVRTEQVDTCQSPKCVVLSGKMLSKMDVRLDPCDDFYEYACSGFLRNGDIPPSAQKYGTFAQVAERNAVTVKKLLDAEGSTYKGVNSTAVQKARAYYRTCMNITANEGVSPDRLKKVINDLGSWPLLDDPISGHWDSAHWSFEHAMARSYWYAQNPLFQMGIGIDDKNNTVQKILFDQSGTTFANQENYKGNETEKYHELYLKLVQRIAELLGRDTNDTEDIEDMWQLELAMAKAFDTPEERSDASKVYHLKTVDEVQTMLGNTIDLKVYLKQALGSEIPGNEEVIVQAPNYLTKLSSLMDAASHKTLANYIVWHTVLSMLSSMPMRFRLVLQDIMHAITGVDGSGDTWKGCVASTNGRLGFASGALFIEEIAFTEKQKNDVETILFNIREQFIQKLPTVAWMDEETSAKAVDKATTIGKKIGYPDFIMDPKQLDEYYQWLNITENDPFGNELNYRFYRIQQEVAKRGNPPDFTEWSMYPSEVNAYYSPVFNEMVFPAGILQDAFYDKDMPWSAIYGAIGMVMGHELTHAFDNNGRQYDKSGNLHNWWTNESAEAFLNKTKCLIDQYSQYTVGGEHLNGVTTLGENIADNSGVEIAYEAYKSWASSTGDSERPLPGLNMTSDQMFFLSFTQLWCSYYAPEYALQSLVLDEHSYAKYRIIGTLTNTPAFAEAYQCPVDSPMNPTKKCQVW